MAALKGKKWHMLGLCFDFPINHHLLLFGFGTKRFEGTEKKNSTCTRWYTAYLDDDAACLVNDDDDAGLVQMQTKKYFWNVFFDLRKK